MKNYILIPVLLFSCFLIGCSKTETSDSELTKKTERIMQEANRQVPVPAIVNFQERKLMKMIIELRDQEDLVCYAYIINMHGEKIFLGKCIGYGLPYSVQFTNPEKVIQGDHQLGYDLTGHVNYPMTIPQPDPNGLFMPEGLSATWLMLIDPETNQARPVYVEPQIMVSPFKLH